MDEHNDLLAKNKQEIKKIFAKIQLNNKRNKSLLDKAKQLKVEQRELNGKALAKLTDNELYYLMELVLQKQLPSTKAFKQCTAHFNKDENWNEQVIRFPPISEQVERILARLDENGNQHFKLVKQHKLFNKKKLLGGKEIRSVLSYMKQITVVANKLESKNLEITRLNNVLETQSNEIVYMKKQLLEQQVMTPKEFAFELNRHYPQMSYVEIAERTGLTRQTVSTYLNEIQPLG